MSSRQIRRADIGDAAGLARAIDAAYAVYDGRIDDLPAVSDGIEEDIRTNHVWVAEVDEAIAGGLILVVGEGFAQLANIAVDPQFAGLGLGRALIERAESECRARGIDELRLATHIAIPENVRLYAHLGWHETERTGNKVMMTKRL